MLHRLSRPLKYGIILLEITLALTAFLLAYNFLIPIGKGDRFVHFEDTNRSGVLRTLTQSGYTVTDWDRYFLPDTMIQKSGWYRMEHQNEGRYRFFMNLDTHPARTMHIKVYAGETYHELTQRLANDLKLDAATLEQLYEKHSRYKEADIFAGTYTLPRKADTNTTMRYLFSTSQKRREAFIRKHFSDIVDDYTVKLLLTIASIIQKESNDPKEMPVIASVIYNRLERGMRLQMDSTLNYGKYSHCIVTPERIRNDTSYYNTYKHKGLPPAPLAAVSLDSLHAAMFPAKSDYLFFMLYKDGGHRFAKTYQEHLTYLKDFRAYQKRRKKCLEKESNTTAKRSQKLAENH